MALRGLPHTRPQVAQWRRDGETTALDLISSSEGDALVDRFVRRGRVRLGDGGVPIGSALRSSGADVAAIERARVRAAALLGSTSARESRSA